MSANLEAKKLVVEDIKAKISASKSVVLVNYKGLTVAEDVVKDNLVQLRNKIYGTNETLEEQIANAASTKGPQYKVTVKATTN